MMAARPGSTFFRTAAGSSGAEEAPLPDALSCGPGTSPEVVPAAGAARCQPNATVTPAPMLAASAATTT